MKPDTDVLLRTPDSSRLHPGKVSATCDKGCTAVFESNSLDVEEGTELFIYYQIRRCFMQQPARVVSVAPEEETRLLIELETTGDPVSAENRECYRVSCYAANVKAQFGEEPEMCEVLDLSATGFAVFSTAEHAVGKMLQATLYHNGDPIDGTVVVQSAREFGKKMRYGLRALDDQRPKATLKSALNRINLSVQREQAARLSGNR